MKVSIVDVETTGLDSDINELIEIGLVVFDSETFEIFDIMDVKIKPKHPEIHHPLAYTINGYAEESWEDALPLRDAMEEYIQKVRGSTFCAHNMVVDFTFIHAALKKAQIMGPDGILVDGINLFDRHRIDLFTFAWAKIPQNAIPKWSLKNICEYLEVPPEPTPHRAIHGAMAEYEVFKKLSKLK